jgi:hypothetical protein
LVGRWWSSWQTAKKKKEYEWKRIECTSPGRQDMLHQGHCNIIPKTKQSNLNLNTCSCLITMMQGKITLKAKDS